MRTKAIKRLETYKEKGPRQAAKKYLVPLSLGPCSTTLLYILDDQFRNQRERTGRTSFELTVVNVDLKFSDPEASSQHKALYTAIQERFPSHTYISLGIEDALSLSSIDWSSLGIQPDASLPSTDRLQSLLKSISTATSRADIASTLLSRLLVDVATKHDCAYILHGDSTTRLAEKTLTETAKGRGFSLPWQVSDGASPFGPTMYYPMRDLLKKEIIQFTKLVSDPPLEGLIIPERQKTIINTTSKGTTIEDLMTQYFESVEENYPSIVANVVRTGSKLEMPKQDGDEDACGLCGIPVAKGTDGIYGWGGDQTSANKAMQHGLPAKTQGILCYGCSRSING